MGKGLVNVVTGGTSGIGLGISRELARQKERVLLSGRDEHKLENVKAELLDLGARDVYAIAGDITDYFTRLGITGALKDLHAKARLYSCAGLFKYDSELDSTTQPYLYKLNAEAPSHLMHIRDWKNIIVVNSTGGIIPFESTRQYGNSKKELDRLSVMATMKHLPVQIVYPGNVETPGAANIALPPEDKLNADDLGAYIAHAPEFDWVSAIVVPIKGKGLQRDIPFSERALIRTLNISWSAPMYRDLDAAAKYGQYICLRDVIFREEIAYAKGVSAE